VTTGGGAVWTIGQEDGVVTRVDPRTKRIEARIYANIPGFGGDVTYGAGYVWTTLVGVPLTKIDASTNRIVAQWYGRGRRRDSLQLRHDLARGLRPPSRLADQAVARSLRAEGYIVR